MASSTRDRILDACLRAFATRGVDGTPITDIEEAAGLAPGSGGFYRYFRTKEEALEAVVRREIDRTEARQEERGPVGDAGDREGAVRDALHDGLRTLHGLGGLIAILAREHGRIPELASEVAARLVDGGLRDDSPLTPSDADGHDPTAQGAVVLSALVGYALATDYFGAPPGGVDEDRFVEALARLVATR